MFSRLGAAVAEENAQGAVGLLGRVHAFAAHDRTDEENRTAAAAVLLAPLVRSRSKPPGN